MEISKLIWASAFAQSVRETTSASLLKAGYQNTDAGLAQKARDDANVAVTVYKKADMNMGIVPVYVSDSNADHNQREFRDSIDEDS